MSKLDRQLDAIHGQDRFVIKWARGEEIDLNQLRQQLIDKLEKSGERLPVDLRGVDGAPQALVELLKETRRQARTMGKTLAFSSMRPEMEQALTPARYRKNKTTTNTGEQDADASELAKSVLDSRFDEGRKYNVKGAEVIERTKKKKRRKKSKPSLKRYLTLAAIVLIATGIIGYIQYLVIFGQKEPILAVPDPKAFEGGYEMRYWSDSTGKHRIQAKFVEEVGSQVRLLLRSGEKNLIDFSRLSKADQEYVVKQRPTDNPFKAE